MRNNAVTLYDVAREAGVSYQTVSRVVNQSTHVSVATRERVYQAIDQLNYVPNKVAQQLAGKRSHTLGLATTSLALHAPSQIAAAIKTRASQERYHTVIAMVDSLEPRALHDAIKSLIAQRVDGIIINIPLTDDGATAMQQLAPQLPMIFTDVCPSSQVNYVLFDPAQGSRLAIERLVHLGHRAFFLLTGPAASISATLRGESATLQLQANNLAPVLSMAGDWSAQSGFEATVIALAQKHRFTAVVVANDQMALGTLRALSEAGFRVPDDVSVIGYDDTYDSAFFTPPLTTIAQDFVLLGNTSVEQLLALLSGEQRCRTVLPVRLVERSTAAAFSDQRTTVTHLSEQLDKIATQLRQLSEPPK
ncbi:LacI family DNA-binding transcriptional regulator [Tatumella sp. TA1]|nr:LacI family DNA-binding transcriptional regulator [Tatumella sp. TA1]